MKAKFIGGLTIVGKITIKLLVSMGNESQKKEELKAFLDLIKRHSGRIEGLEIYLSDYLHRHYVGKEESLELGNQWLEENKVTIEESGLNIRIKRWKEILDETEWHSVIKPKINTLYQENEEFKKNVDILAIKHKSKGNSLKFLLEESGVISLLTGYITYPSSDLNPAIKKAIKYMNSQVNYIGYTISHPHRKENLRQEPTLLACCLTTSELMAKNGIFGEKQGEFFREFVKLTENFSVMSKKDSKENETENSGLLHKM